LKWYVRMKTRSQTPHRLIRQIETGLYLSPDGQWVRHEQDAFDFPDLRSALATCEQMQAGNVEMILIFDPSPPGERSHFSA
jgi:hypothetical protein